MESAPYEVNVTGNRYRSEYPSRQILVRHIASWAVHHNQYCLSEARLNTYSTRDEAVAGCEADSSCAYIYDQSCDSSGDWVSCSSGGLDSSSSGSCVYSRPGTSSSSSVQNCTFTPGDGIGGSERRVGDTRSAAECEQLVRGTVPTANGATYRNDGGTD